MHTFRLALAALAAALTLAACGGSSTPAASTTPPAARSGDDPTCPVSVPGTSVSVEDTATGAAFVFVTTGDVAAVRERVAALAAMHNDHHGKMGPLPDGNEAAAGHDHGAMHGGHAGHGGGGAGEGDHAGHGEHAGHGGGSMGQMIGVHSKAEAVEIDGGARLVLTVGANDVAALQDELRKHAQHLGTGTCAMGHH